MTLDPTFGDQALLEELGARIARYRLNRNLTQEALAEQAGVSRATVARLEKGGSASLTNVIRLLRALNLLKYLDALVPEPPPSPIQQLRTKKRQRRRATSTSTSTSAITDGGTAPPHDVSGAAWAWGDDE